MTYNWVCKTTRATSGARIVCHCGAHEFIPGLWWGSSCSVFWFSVLCSVDHCLSLWSTWIHSWPLMGFVLFSLLVFCVVFCRSLFIIVEHMNSFLAFDGFVLFSLLVFCVVFCRSLFIIVEHMNSFLAFDGVRLVQSFGFLCCVL